MTFTTFVLFQMFNVFNARTERESVFSRQLVANRQAAGRRGRRGRAPGRSPSTWAPLQESVRDGGPHADPDCVVPGRRLHRRVAGGAPQDRRPPPHPGAVVTDEREPADRDPGGHESGDEPVAEQLADLFEAAVEAEREGEPEETRSEAERHVVIRIARVGLGLVVLGAGLALIPLPGPGLLVVAAGLALMSRDVPFARRWLEQVRERLPEGEGGGVAAWVIVVSVMGALVSVGASVWWTLLR